MAKNNNLTDFLTNTANAIRSVEGLANTDANKINPQDFEARIKALKKAPTGNIQLTKSSSTDVSTYATATVRAASGISATEKVAPTIIGYIDVSSTATEIIAGNYGYKATSDNLHGYTISASTSGWFSSADVGLPNGAYVGYVPQYTATTGTSASGNSLSLTVTPSTANKYVNITTGYRPASYLTVSGDSNLVAGNIKSGVSIFGVSGTYTGLVPTGNIQLTTNASTDITNYATATVKTGSATTPATTITANPSAPTLNSSNNKYYVTVSKTQNVIPSVSAGWVSSGTAGTITVSGSTEITKGAITNNTSGGTSSGTVNFGKQLKVSAGWYPSDLYYTAQNPSGNIQLTTSSSTNVAAYATATVRSASSYSLAITDKSTTAPTMGSYSSGYYSITTSLTGTLTAGTSGWFSSGSATDSSVIVGRLPRVALTSSTTAPTGDTLVTVTPSTSTKYVYASTGGYFPTPASNAPRIAVSGDSNLVAGNIKSGISIFGVTGTYSGGGLSNYNISELGSFTLTESNWPDELELTIKFTVQAYSATVPTTLIVAGGSNSNTYYFSSSDDSVTIRSSDISSNLFDYPIIIIAGADEQSVTGYGTLGLEVEHLPSGHSNELEYGFSEGGNTRSILYLVWTTKNGSSRTSGYINVVAFALWKD